MGFQEHREVDCASSSGIMLVHCASLGIVKADCAPVVIVKVDCASLDVIKSGYASQSVKLNYALLGNDDGSQCRWLSGLHRQ